MEEEREDESQDDVELDEFKVHEGKTYQRVSGGSQFMKRQLHNTPCLSILLLTLILLLLLVIVLQVVTIVSINKPTPDASAAPSSAAAMSQLIKSFNTSCVATVNDSLLNQIYDVTQTSAQKLHDIVRTLSNLEDSSYSSKGIVDDILFVADELLQIHINNSDSSVFPGRIPSSCEDIKKYEPDSPSGYYHINNLLVYCEMGELCGVNGTWTRIAHLDMADSAQNCPSNFRFYQSDGIRGCGRPSGGPSCASVQFSADGVSYSEVCGRVIGYQYGSPDAVDTRFVSDAVHDDINQNYADGVSITYGYPRQHIWTLMAGVFENNFDLGNCPCNSPNSSTQSIQSFIQDDYYCESGNPTSAISGSFYGNDPLWNGKECGSQEQDCCAIDANLPWFYRKIDPPTTDHIELRECGDENIYNEDVIVHYYDIYVK